MADKFTSSAVQLKPDTRYGSLLASKFINCLMYDGKKSTAEAVFYGSMDFIGERLKESNPIDVFTQALENCKPGIEVRSRRVGGANYQVPTPVNSKRAQSLAIRWILEASRGKKGKPMSQRLAEELMAAYRREGAAMNTREQMHRMADANKAFAHFAY